MIKRTELSEILDKPLKLSKPTIKEVEELSLRPYDLVLRDMDFNVVAMVRQDDLFDKDGNRFSTESMTR